MIDWLKKHWIHFALVLVGLALGHFVSPRTVTVTTADAKQHTVTAVDAKQSETKTAAKDTTKTVIIYKDTVTRKDGSSETKEETKEETGIAERSADDTLKDTVTHKDDTLQSTTTTTVTKGGAAPKWFVGAGLGVGLQLRAPYISTPFIHVDVSRRLWGPFSVGAWGSLDITGNNPALGLELGVTF